MSENALSSSDNSTQRVPPRTRYTSLWFADGNVVLLCSAAQGDMDETAFRIHRSILSHHSKVFKDMFSVGEGANEDSDMMDGCPVVRVQDKADDMANLLRRLYSLESREVRKSPSLELISSIMGLASKYIMEGLRQELVDDLLNIFPTSLDDYMNSSLSPSPDNPLLGIDIGLKYELPAIIPTACYRAALLDEKKIFDGFRLSDGTSTVSVSARALCMRFKTRLGLWINGWTGTFAREERPYFLPNDHRCDTYSPYGRMCNGISAYRNESLAMMYGDFKLDFFSDDEQQYYDHESTESYDDVPCRSCLSFVRDAGGDFREAAWKLLPKFCDLEDWDALLGRAADRDSDPEDAY
ncbi:hypothetical protein OF83DRAFT_1170710 [Amylostereum chailletii]|nr:hypothetical protein OF83DRAFT_1170710 [Amylostereum chailletii]